MSKNILVLQHIPIETPGYILDLMIEDKINIELIKDLNTKNFYTYGVLEKSEQWKKKQL